MPTKRLFIGTFVDKQLFSHVYSEIIERFNRVSSGKWVEPDNLHFTYLFLGDMEAELVPEIKGALKDYLKEYPSELLIKGLNVFPNPRSPRVLHIEVHNQDNIVMDAYNNISKIMLEYGYEPEERKYTPHVTLCRLKTFRNPDFRELLNSYKEFKIGSMDSFSINLIESILRREGPMYLRV